MKKSILLLAFIFISTLSFAQLSQILYKIQYNESTNLFDCKMYVDGGFAASAAERLQLPAQFSIVAETGVTITVEEKLLPLYNNETYTGTVPMDWSIENTAIDPVEFPGYNVFAIVPDISGQPAHYNDLSVEDEVTLFSLSAVGADICSVSLRVFENDDDPSMIGGIDFTNTMMIGTTNEIYIGNEVASNVWGDVDVTVNNGEICEGECITLTLTPNCIFPGIEYEWSTGETTESITVCPEVSQQYILSMTGPFEFFLQVASYVDVDTGIDPVEGTDLCVGIMAYFFPEYGIWTSSDENIATVNNDGIVTPIAPGTVTISHTNSSGNCLDEIEITVVSLELPTIEGSDEICPGETTQLTPSSGVTWYSNNATIATVDNNGLVTAVGFGSTDFYYTLDSDQCQSEPSPIVTVLQIPEPEILFSDTICVDGETFLSPSAGVSWVSSNEIVAMVENNGRVIGISEGSATFSFTDQATGCTSDESEPVTVSSPPIVELSSDSVCQYTVVNAESNMVGGTWQLTVVSGGPFVASIDNLGTIETDNPGTVIVQYISKEGCASDESVLLTILPQPTPDVTSNSPLCMGENLTLFATPPPGTNYTYEWSGPNGFTSNEQNVIIPNAELNLSGVYRLIARENGCASDEIHVDVLVEDCNPCDDETSPEDWIKLMVSDDVFTSVGDYEIGSSLVTGRELEDFVYYNEAQQDVRLVKNTGSEFFEEEIVLFDLPYFGPIVIFDIVDIDQDGLNDIITYQAKTHFVQPGIDTLLITIFNNKDNYSFDSTLSLIENSGLDFTQYPVTYSDLDNQGFLDIIPFAGSIYFTEEWNINAYPLPFTAGSVLVEDFNEDGLLDVLRNNKEILLNNGDYTFDLAMIEGAHITEAGFYDSENQIFISPFTAYQITTGDNPYIDACTDLFVEGTDCFFTANINSNSFENGVNITLDGFNTFQLPMNCNNISNYNSNVQFRPDKDGRIDLTGNGYTDFITVENGTIVAWINPIFQPKIKGTAFIDNNGDGMLNENDSPLRNVLISIEPGDLSVLTDDNGAYQLAIPEGTYTLTAKVNEGEWITDELTIDNIEIIEPCNLGFDFGFVPDPTPIPSVNLSMVNTIARCDFETRFTITVENIGTEPLVSLLQFEFDDKTTLFEVEFSGSTTIGNKVIASIGPLLPFQPQEYRIKVKMPSGSAVLPMLDFKASLVNSIGETIAEYGYTEQLRCSYDPNDKRAFPDREGDENLTLMDEDIEYTIRFQNNGNDTAYTVKIVDPLDSNIDPSSIRVVGSSHDVETCIERTDLIFLFENIYLVDSATNYEGSQGYVTFKCNAKDGRAEFTEAFNSADIFFDTNLPITTNQTINTLVSELCTDKSTVIDKYICDGEEYLGYSETGTYTESHELNFGCDSLVTIILTVQGITYSQQDFEVCKGEFITLGSEEYLITEDVIIIDTIFSDLGCISNILKYKITAVDLEFAIDELEICLYGSGSIFVDLGGEWTVEDETILQIEDGIITALSPGTTTIEFLYFESGCSDDILVEVHALPVINNEGSDQICIDESSQFTADTDGIWESFNPGIATVSQDGLVTGLEAGTASIAFFDLFTGCTASKDVIILPATHSNCLVSTSDLTAQSVQLYPNPTRESIFIETKEKWNAIRLMNAQGQLLSKDSGRYEVKKKIDLDGISSGLYFMVVEMESGMVIKKFVVD